MCHETLSITLKNTASTHTHAHTRAGTHCRLELNLRLMIQPIEYHCWKRFFSHLGLKPLMLKIK
jgi:hypothetical protein